MWAYQRERAQIKKREWDSDHKEHNRLYRQDYREDRPEQTQRQQLKDWRAFVQRDPERWREINRKAARRFSEKQRKLRQAEREAIAREGATDNE